MKRGFLVLLAILAVATAGAYSFIGTKWSGTRITMYLQLGSASGGLVDGASSWDDVAAGALGTWNRYLSGVQFVAVRNSTREPADGDRINNVFFDSTIYGFSFDDAVAITTQWASGSRRVEADVIFNSNLNWNSYRGDLRRSGVGGRTVYDLRRVALHEFGHVLGLDHPDENGQSVTAIMNSRVSDLDDLQADDIRGGQALYGARLQPWRARFTRPTGRTLQTASPSYLFRGQADVAQANAVFLVNNRLGARKFYRAGGLLNWQLRLALRPGRNRVRLYVRIPGGSRVKVAERVVISRPRN